MSNDPAEERREGEDANKVVAEQVKRMLEEMEGHASSTDYAVYNGRPFMAVERRYRESCGEADGTRFSIELQSHRQLFLEPEWKHEKKNVDSHTLMAQ